MPAAIAPVSLPLHTTVRAPVGLDPTDRQDPDLFARLDVLQDPVDIAVVGLRERSLAEAGSDLGKLESGSCSIEDRIITVTMKMDN